MGRGRAKAKQTKVARELKYSSPQTDFSGFSRSCQVRAPMTPTGWTADGEQPDDSWSDQDDWRR